MLKKKSPIHGFSISFRTGLKDGQLHSANCVYHKFWGQFAFLLDLHTVTVNQCKKRIVNTGSGCKSFTVNSPSVLRNEIRKVTG